MYLSAKLRSYKTYKGQKKDKRREGIRKLYPEMFMSGNIEYIGVEFEAGYWRKANHIHKWFVENVQDGNDDCRPHDVSRNDLKLLLKLCEEVKKINDSAEDLLPTTAGFFFGCTEYDEWYFKQIDNTIEIIKKCLKLPDDWDFEYHSSW